MGNSQNYLASFQKKCDEKILRHITVSTAHVKKYAKTNWRSEEKKCIQFPVETPNIYSFIVFSCCRAVAISECKWLGCVNNIRVLAVSVHFINAELFVRQLFLNFLKCFRSLKFFENKNVTQNKIDFLFFNIIDIVPRLCISHKRRGNRNRWVALFPHHKHDS